MIDTIILVVPMREVVSPGVRCDGWTEWNGWELNANRGGFKRYIKNGPLNNSDEKIYLPRLTGYQTWDDGFGEWSSQMKVEFSAPKIIYGQNLDELSADQFGDVVLNLQSRLSLMGIDVSEETLVRARVSAVHYSKNLLLENGYTTQYVIGQLRKINLNKRIKHTNVEYSNDGDKMSLYTKSYSVDVYDKIQELYHEIDRDIVNALSRKANVMRFEARLKKRTMNELFKKLGHAKDPVFSEVFSEEKSKAVLNYYWNNMLSKDAVILFSRGTGPKELLREILRAQQGAKAARAIYLMGLLLLSRDGDGIRELRGVLGQRITQHTWYGIVKNLRNIGSDLSEARPDEWHNQICRQLNEYRPMRMLAEMLP
jgi:hypothetical protein